MLDSAYIGAIEATPLGVSWTGSGVQACGKADDKLYQFAGFSGTLTDSAWVGSIDAQPTGLEHGNYAERTAGGVVVPIRLLTGRAA